MTADDANARSDSGAGAMSDQPQVRCLPEEMSEVHTVRNAHSTTSFHPHGITLRGPLVEDETENKSDRGTRLTIHSSHGARNSNYGEGIRLIADTPQAKNMIAWYDGFTTPGKLRPRAWFGYHYGTYPDVVHDHISIETPAANGALHTRFAISTAPSQVTNIDFNMSDVQHTASQGGAVRLVVSPKQQASFPRDLVFATGVNRSDATRRWALRADTTPESGNNEGSLFRLVRYNDRGVEFDEDTVIVSRSTGNIGIGTQPDSSWKVNVGSHTGGIKIATKAPTGRSVIRVEAPAVDSIVVDSRKPDDVHERFRISTAGHIEWGSGSKAVDTSLRRTEIRKTNVLATNSDLYFDDSSKGPILRSPNGTLFRLTVNNRGRLMTEKV